MGTYLLLAAIVMIACVLLNRLSGKMGIPMLLFFILLGMFFGSDGVVRIPFDNYGFAEQVCSIALVLIMFYGGFGTRWQEARPVAVRATLLSTVGVALTAGLTGVFCHYALGISWAEGMLIGAVISSTDAASVFSILRSRRLNLKDGTASLLEMESGSNDPCAYMLTVIMMSVMNGTAKGGGLAYLMFAQIVYGAAIGVGMAVVSVFLMKRAHYFSQGFDAILVLALALLSYALPDLVGGNGYLSVYIVGIALGNAKLKDKPVLVHFFDGVTGLMQMLVFFLLGLLSFPTKLGAVLVPALLIAVFLTVVARPVAVFALLKPFKASVPQCLSVSWAGLRGAASIVFAIMAMMGVQTQNDIFHIVFTVVLFSILLQGSLLPLIVKKLNMMDDNADVMKTFSDYSEELPVEFMQCRLKQSHPWCGKQIKDLLMPPDTLVALIERGGEKTAPNGDTLLMENDTIVLCAPSLNTIAGVSLSERRILKGGEWEGKALSELEGLDGQIIVLIRRGDNTIIPKGNTVLLEGDLLVINHSE